MKLTALLCSLFTLLLFTGGCSTSSADDTDLLLGRSTGPAQNYTFVFLVTDRPVDSFTEAEMQTAMTGHFNNMSRLAEEGTLLIAGPLGEPRSDPDHRGVFIFDVPTVEEARALTMTDPSVQMDVFNTRIYPFRSTDALKQIPAWEQQATAERKAANPDADDFAIRPYVLASAAHGQAAEQLFAADERVVFAGRFGDALTGTTLFALDAADVDAARAIVSDVDPEGAAAGAWMYHPWFASQTLVRLQE